MTEKRKVLGRGIETLLPSRQPSPPSAQQPVHRGEVIHQLAVELIDRNPYQTRTHVDEGALQELADSIKSTGILQPITVRAVPGGRYQLIAGERRWLASQRAGKSTVPAIVRQVSNEQAMEITIIENLQREDLNPIEQARAFERLSREFGLTQEQIASRTGKDRASISNFIRLLKLPDSIQELVENGGLTLGHGKALCGLLGFPDELARAAAEVVGKSLSVRQTEELVSKIINPEQVQSNKPQSKPVDPNVREAARTLEQALGVKVEILDRKGKGKIILKYGSLEDFDRIVEVLSQR